MNQGEKIRKRRQELDLTQAELGTMVGQTRAHISYIEKTGRVNYHTYQAIAKALGLSTEYYSHKMAQIGDTIQTVAESPTMFQRVQDGALSMENTMLRKEVNSLKQIVELQKMVIEMLKKELEVLKN